MPSVAFLKASLALWRRRWKYRRKKEIAYKQRGQREQASRAKVTARTQAQIDAWSELREEASGWITRRKEQLAAHPGVKPRIITSAQLGLRFQYVFGKLGQLVLRTGHYTAGPRARNATDLVRIARQVHSQHASQGWGGGSYGPMFADDGTILLLNPIDRKAAHVAGRNTGNHGLNCPGTLGDKPTPAQEASYRWYIAHAHTRQIPTAYRSPVDLRKVARRVHKDMNATACPGDFTPMFRAH